MIVIFDIDNTLANVDDLLKYWDAADPEEFCKRIGEAKIIEKIEKFYKMLWADLHTLIIYSARPEKIRTATEKWLTENGIFYEKLLMAKDNDPRHDIDIKLEMLRGNGLTPDKVAFIVEDRTCVVEALRKAGYTVLQCADGDY
jgi:FMN phosphatase YigB (HAD superfamily)